MRILYTSDLHGHEPLYRQLFERIEEWQPEAVLLGGDLTPTHFGPEGPPLQRAFLEVLLARFDEHAQYGRRFFFIFGNADCAANWEWLEGQARPHAVPLHGRVVEFHGEHVIAGYNHVPVTPLKLKDWEKRDLRDTGWERWDGIRIHAQGVDHVDLSLEAPADGMAADLSLLAVELNGRPSVCVMHSPPSDTHLDCVGPGRHVGSLATRRFLEEHRPRVSLHGHIHESPHLTGHFADRVGETLCINPGQSNGDELHAVVFELEDPAATLRHSLFGAPRNAL